MVQTSPFEQICLLALEIDLPSDVKKFRHLECLKANICKCYNICIAWDTKIQKNRQNPRNLRNVGLCDDLGVVIFHAFRDDEIHEMNWVPALWMVIIFRDFHDDEFFRVVHIMSLQTACHSKAWHNFCHLVANTESKISTCGEWVVTEYICVLPNDLHSRTTLLTSVYWVDCLILLKPNKNERKSVAVVKAIIIYRISKT
jgi:hypothetical protein